MQLPRVLQMLVRGGAAQSCQCGHAGPAHEHYRRGTDCGLCACAKFRAGVAVDTRAAQGARRERVHAA